jgi:hypothetical protein
MKRSRSNERESPSAKRIRLANEAVTAAEVKVGGKLIAMIAWMQETLTCDAYDAALWIIIDPKNQETMDQIKFKAAEDLQAAKVAGVEHERSTKLAEYEAALGELKSARNEAGIAKYTAED